MDMRRLDTGQVIASGILDRVPPTTDIPTDRDEVDAVDRDTWGYVGNDRATEALEGGMIVTASNYYGIPYLWKDGEGYQGRLLQYRAVTEAVAFSDLDDALEWFEDTYHRTDG